MTLGKRYFLISLATPIIVPIGLYPFGINNVLSVLLFFSLAFGGIPYLIMCVGIIIWARRKNEIQIRRLSYIVPFIFLAVMAVTLFAWLLYESGSYFKLKDFFGIILLFSVYGLVIGYSYVLLVNLIYELTLSTHEDAALTKPSTGRAKTRAGDGCR